MMRYATFTLLVLVLSATAYSQALIYEYEAGIAPDDGTDAVWEASVDNSAIHTAANRDWDLTGHTFLPDAGSSYAGINSAYRFSGTASGGTTAEFGQPTLPLGPTQSDAAGASSTIEIWLRPNSATLDGIGNEVLFEAGGSTNGHVLAFQAGAATGVDLVYSARSNNGTQAASPPLTLTENLTDPTLLDDFIQVAVTIDPGGAGDDTKLFVNGQLVASEDNWASWQRGNNGAGLGRVNSQIPDLVGGFFDGDIALLRLYDYARSEQDIADSFDAIVRAQVPEPASITIWSLLGLGLAAFGYVRIRPRRSNEEKSQRWESNPQPPHYECGALPIEATLASPYYIATFGYPLWYVLIPILPPIRGQRVSKTPPPALTWVSTSVWTRAGRVMVTTKG